MPVSIAELRGKVKRPIRSVSVCLDGELWARHDDLTRALDELRVGAATKMSESSAARAVAEELQQVEAAMRDSSEVVQFRGISLYQLKEIKRRFPAKDRNMDWDPEEGAAALIAACAVEPITEDDARAFLEEAHNAVADQFFNAAWLATTGSSDVPFSVRASALINGSASK